MIIGKPEKYEEIQVNLEFVPISLGGHKGIIKSVSEYKSEFTGNTSLKVEVDTSQDDTQPGYFQEQYDNNTNADKKWPTGAVKYVSLKQDENCVKMLKAFITAVENSNAGFEYDWAKDIEQLKGKKVGLVFGYEEYSDNDGNTKLATKLNQFRSVDKVDNVKIPKVRTLDGSYIEYDEYMETRSAQQKADIDDAVSVIINDDELPF